MIRHYLLNKGRTFINYGYEEMKMLASIRLETLVAAAGVEEKALRRDV